MTTETTAPASDTTEERKPLEDVIAALPPTYRALAEVNLRMLTDFAEAANNLSRQVAAQENVETTILDIIENSEDDELTKFRAWRDEQNALIAQAESQAREVAKGMLGDLDTVDPEKALAEWTVLNQQYQATTRFMEKNPVADFSEVLQYAPAIESMGRKRGSGNGPSVRRPRVSNIEYRVGSGEWQNSYTDHKSRTDGTVTRTVGFPALSANLKELTGVKVDPGTLIQEADSAAGTDKWVTLDGKPFTFHVSVDSADDKPGLVEVRVTPKAADKSDDE